MSTCSSAKRLIQHIYVDTWDQNRAFWLKWEVLCLEKGEHCIPEPYPICETWWWEYCSLGLFWCIWARPACHQWWNNKLWILPDNLTRENMKEKVLPNSVFSKIKIMFWNDQVNVLSLGAMRRWSSSVKRKSWSKLVLMVGSAISRNVCVILRKKIVTVRVHIQICDVGTFS